MADEKMKKLLIETPVDKLVILAKQKRGITVSEAAKLLGASEQQVEEWTRILEERGLLKLEFPVVGPPKIVPAMIPPAKFSRKIEEFAQRKEEIEMLAQNYLEQSRETEKQFSLKFVPVERELYGRLKEVEGSIKALGMLSGMEKKMESDISKFEEEKAEVQKEAEEIEKRASHAMKNIDSVKSSSEDLASDIGEALADMQKREKGVRILSDEQKRIEGEMAALDKEIRIVSALAARKPGKTLMGKISGLIRGKPKRKNVKSRASLKEDVGIIIQKKQPQKKKQKEKDKTWQ